MTFFSEKLKTLSEQITYDNIRSVAPASLNAQTDVMGTDGYTPPVTVIPYASRSSLDSETSKKRGLSPQGARPKSGNCGMNGVVHDPKSAVREALEAVARMLETRAGNAVYQSAWRVAAKLIRSYKPD